MATPPKNPAPQGPNPGNSDLETQALASMQKFIADAVTQMNQVTQAHISDATISIQRGPAIPYVEEKEDEYDLEGPTREDFPAFDPNPKYSTPINPFSPEEDYEGDAF